jgi:PAS domain S-box-containing protein
LIQSHRAVGADRRAALPVFRPIIGVFDHPAVEVMAVPRAKVLFIENDPLHVQVIEEMAVTEGGPFDLEIAEGLGNGLERLSRGEVDLILLGLAVFDSRGLGAFTEIHTNFPFLPVIVLTANGNEKMARAALEAGAEDYLVKWQADSHALQRSMQRALERQNGAVSLSERETERKLAEELQLLLGSAVHYANDSILITTAQIDPPGPYIVFVNPALSRMTGYAAQELIGKTPRILQGPKTNRRTLQKIREHLARGESFSGEMVNYRKDGSEYVVEWHISPIRNRDHGITHFVSVQHDVTARRKIEERLREQADLLDNATDAIILLDLEEKVIFWSSGAERLYGWTFNEIKSKRLYDVLYQETPARFEEIKQTLVSQGKWRGEQTQIGKNGAEIIVESRWTLICDEQNNPRSIFVINTDITEKKRLEAVVLRAQRLESIGALASGIAHDLNNVLAPILMALHTLQQRFTDESSQRWISLMSKSAERGRDLIERVLAFARGAEGERAPLQTASLIRDISRILKETLPKDIELQVQVPDDLWSVIGDTTQIHQVLMNLCINARDAMPNGGRLLIKARNRYLVEEEKRLVTNPFQKQYVRITVADTGVGIPPEIIDRVFDPFFTTKEKGKGSGLGLSTVMSIVRGHGGFVNVLSKVARGTEFKVYLPAQDAANIEMGVADQVDLPTGKGELILVVDDEADIREITSTTLEEYGYRVLSAGNGREALDIYRQYENEVQLVVTDMVMPHLDGPATIRALRQITPNLKVIATSGVRSTGQLVDVMKLGVKAFLTKPYTAERLLAVVAESLNGQATV